MNPNQRDPRIDCLVKQACAKIHSRKTRERVAQELSNHIEESVATKREAGLEPEAALAQALAEFGDARMLGKTLARVHRPVYFTAPFLAAAVTCLMLIVGSYLQYCANAWLRYFDEAMVQETMKYRASFLADEKLLSGQPTLDFPGMKADAGEFLNTRLRWCGDSLSNCPTPYESLRRPASLLIPERAQKLVSSWHSQWVEHSIEVPEVDTSWMRELRRFDHWDFFVYGPLADVYRTYPDQVTAWGFPIPHFMELRDFARIRLLQGIREHRLLPALKEVDHFAMLVHSTEFQISSIIAAQILDDERTAALYGRSRGLLAPGQWREIPEGLPKRARRAFYAYSGMFHHTGDVGWMARLLSDPATRAGLCGALNEGIWSDAWIHSYLENSLPLERDYSKGLAALDQVLRKTRGSCRLTLARGFWDNPERVKSWYRSTKEGWRVRLLWGYLAEVPLIRQWALADLGRNGIPGYFIPYERDEVSTKHESKR